ncbi:RNA-binding protein [Candidatus Woesearchaeota archaeon]|nr:RNA-binding protein [Candidatus Woesearchaeota archaeon]
MEETLAIQDKDIAVPGEVLAHGMGFLPSAGTYRKDEDIVCSRLGLVSVEGKVIRITPLSGVYTPKIGDKIIGKVIDVLLSGWRIDTRSPYSAVLSTKDATSEFIGRGVDLRQYFNMDDWLCTKIVNVTSQKLVDVTMRGPGLRKLVGGRVITANPYKVPRIVGKDGSMSDLIKAATGCQLVVGQNGCIWLDGQPEMEVLAVDAIRMIEEEAHLPGLTDRVKALLEQRTGKQIDLAAIPKSAPEESAQYERSERFEGHDRGPREAHFRPRGPPRNFRR